MCAVCCVECMFYKLMYCQPRAHCRTPARKKRHIVHMDNSLELISCYNGSMNFMIFSFFLCLRIQQLGANFRKIGEKNSKATIFFHIRKHFLIFVRLSKTLFFCIVQHHYLVTVCSISRNTMFHVSPKHNFDGKFELFYVNFMSQVNDTFKLIILYCP